VFIPTLQKQCLMPLCFRDYRMDFNVDATAVIGSGGLEFGAARHPPKSETRVAA
jgi:hypothetical protein